tara:strand:+ start:2104 stop:2694 length:591 start_codon:yes stop_codon:yes gene_type:complete
MAKDLHFPTPIYIFDHNDKSLNMELEKNIINWMNNDKGVQRSNVEGWHSPTDMQERPEYKKLVNDLFEAQYKIYNEEYLDSEPCLGNMWANVNPPGGYNNAHIHPNALWSGVYYVKTPKNCGNLKINDPRAAASMTRPRNKSGKLPIRLWREVNYEPKAGRCIMFPAWLTHCVDVNRSNDVRISVSFNFMQKCMVV